MTRNILFCVIGIILGFVLGFFIANAGWVARPATGSARSAPDAAGPLDPQQQAGPLPPGHPSVGNANDRSGGAASSPQTQNAMDAADRNPRDFEAQMTAAATFYQAEAYDRAVVYLERALKLKPADTDALTAMGDTRYDLGDYAEAAKYYERSLQQKPDDINVQTDLGNTYFQRQPPDYDRAIIEYRKALAINPNHEKTLQNLAAAAVRKGDKATARDALDRLAVVNPSNPAIASLRSSLEP
ncbi:MAG TPA: tetratricopeptide repeat protein [Pyrinomonadaceae bacterium]